MRAPVLLLAALLTAATALTGCGSDAGPPAASPFPSQAAGPSALAAGRNEVVLGAGTYLSPADFVPPLTVAVPAGWTSTHRGDDAFDLSRPDPGRDAPLVVVSLITPPDEVVASALARLRSAANGHLTPAAGTLLGRRASGFEEVGGTGELVASPSGTLALRSQPGGHLLVLGADVDGVPLLAIVLVPDGTRWATQRPAALRVLASLSPA